MSLYDALQLQNCKNIKNPPKEEDMFIPPKIKTKINDTKRHLIFVDAKIGRDHFKGTKENPVQSLKQALALAHKIVKAVTIILREGKIYIYSKGFFFQIAFRAVFCRKKMSKNFQLEN